MRVRMKEQFICCIFAVILFLTGMCVEIPPADFSFLRAQEVSSVDSISVIRDGSNLVSLERVCTIDMLRRGTTTYLSSSRARPIIKRVFRMVMILYAAAILLSFVSYYGGAAGRTSRRRTSSRETIIRYIQQKDGKK